MKELSPAVDTKLVIDNVNKTIGTTILPFLCHFQSKIRVFLKTILFFGLVVRLIAAIFSQGYGMHDDHK